MTRHIRLALAFVLASSAVAAAQTPPPPMAAGRGITQMYTTIKTNISESAGKMSEADFAFKPTPDVRSYGELLGHVANAGFATCANLIGEANPNKENLEQKSTKADAAASVQRMFAYCDAAFATITDENAAQLMKVGQREIARLLPAVNLVAHLNEHYGNLVTYMRLKGVVPPSTERASRR